MTVDYGVTRYYPSFNPTRDSTTGWKIWTWTADTTPEMPIYPRGAAEFRTPAGYYGRPDFYGWTIDPVYPYEHILHNSDRYEILYVHELYDGDNFIRRDCALTLLTPMYEENAETATWKTSPNDPRSMIKAWIDLRDTPANITKNDGATLASYWTVFAYPAHFHLEWEFRAASSPVQGLYVIDNPTSTSPLFDCDNSVIDYKEMVPIHIMTVDSTDCGAEQLYWKMDAELRRIGQEYPTGSWHQLERTEKRDTFLGSMKLVDRVSYWEYTRGGLT